MAHEDEVTLFRTWSSPFGLRAVWALELKGIQYKTIYEDLSNKSPQLLHYNPIHKKIPVLVHNGKAISESAVVVEYIDETWKDKYPILPKDPYERAEARFLGRFGDEKIIPAIWSSFTEQGKDQEEAIAAAKECLKTLEERLVGKRYFNGETIGFTDVMLGWLANLIKVLEEILELKMIDEEQFPLLFKWVNNIYHSPIIKDTWPPHDKMVLKYRAIQQNHIPVKNDSK